jgi:hypothetical protein
VLELKLDLVMSPRVKNRFSKLTPFPNSNSQEDVAQPNRKISHYSVFGGREKEKGVGSVPDHIRFIKFKIMPHVCPY